MNAPSLIFQIVQIILATVNIVGFSFLYLRGQKPLFRCLSGLFLFLLLDTTVELVGDVIPIFTYYRLTDVSNNFFVMLTKEFSSIGCFYFLRRCAGELTLVPVSEAENRLWSVGAAFILLCKCSPLSQSGAVLGCVFVLYTSAYLLTFVFGFSALYRHREQHDEKKRFLLAGLFAVSLASYLVSCALNLRIMNGCDIQDHFSEASWVLYLLLGTAYLLWVIPRLEASDQTENQFTALKQQYSLTDREVDILRLLAQGRSNPEICQALHIAPGTAKTHIYNLYRKLGINRRSQIQDVLNSVPSFSPLTWQKLPL